MFIASKRPGAGKSYLAKKYLDKYEKDETLVICPTRMLTLEYITEGYHATTYASALGMRINDEGIEQNAERLDLTPFRCVLLDEMGMLKISDKQKIRRHIINKYPNLKLIGAGDENQNPPWDNNLYTTEPRGLHKTHIYSMFPCVIELFICKRMKREDDRVKIDKVYEILQLDSEDEKIDDKKCIADAIKYLELGIISDKSELHKNDLIISHTTSTQP